MGNLQSERLVQSIRRLAGVPAGTGLTDRQLLESFVASKSENAFAALVERHGAMVLGVCRRVLNHLQDAEDAFQATFLVLARKAGAVRWHHDIGDWIHEVAYRTALKARSDVARRRGRELPLEELPAPETTADLAWHELRPILDEEVRRLPERYRRPLVLCYFEDKTYTEAAHMLGVAEGTVSSRLARARDRLRTRLVRRGLTLSAALVSTTIARDALAASVPSNLLHLTIRSAPTAAGHAGAVSAHVAALAERVLRAMFLMKLRIVTGVLLASGLVGGSATFVSYRALAGGERPEQGAAREDRRQDKEQPQRQTQTPKNQAVTPLSVTIQPANVIPAQHITSVFDTNEARADEEFMQKKLKILGIVSRIYREGNSNYILELADGDLTRDPLERKKIEFEFPSDARKELAALQVGQQVSVEGVCQGKIEGPNYSHVFFKNCKLISIHKPKGSGGQ
jgi:RNA polymerase sigma factor (sigma-70 family)